MALLLLFSHSSRRHGKERNLNNNTIKSTLRLSKNLSDDIDSIVVEKARVNGKVVKNDVYIEALELYRDLYYSKNKATFLNDNILATMQGMVDAMEHRLNNKSNQLLSELCIQQAIIAQMLAYSLEVKGDTIAEYRKRAIEFLKVNQRVFKLDEAVE